MTTTFNGISSARRWVRLLAVTLCTAAVALGGCGPATAPEGSASAQRAPARSGWLEDGSPCAPGDACLSGHCVLGTCCHTACDGQCESCDLPGSVGTCVAVVGAPPSNRPPCASDGSACAGACDGVDRTACTYPTDLCRQGSCAAGVATLPAFCDGAGHCPPLQNQNCSPYSCGATACVGTCSTDGDCAFGSFCSAGVCRPRLQNGEPCGGAGQCASGACVDGVCCDTACTGQCQACDVAGHVGACTSVVGTPHGGRSPCNSDGSACGGACDGSSGTACAYPSGSCRAASCSAGVATLAASCDGAGHCPTAQTVPCAPFACGATACQGNCTADGDCAAGAYCAGGVCRPKAPNGTACSGAAQCTSGSCVDGVCCDVACQGQCQACDVTGHVGTCSPVTGAPRGARPRCLGDGSACSGTCNGVDPMACSFAGGGVTCRAASCSGGVQVAPAACNGSGSCPAPVTQACGNYGCGPTGCRGGCTSDADCAATAACISGACLTLDDLRVRGSGCGSGSAGPWSLALLALAAGLRLRRRRRVRLRALGAMAALLLGATGTARAQTATSTSIDVEQFRPGPGARDVLGVVSPQVPAGLGWNARAYLSYAHAPLRLVDPTGVYRVDLLDHQTTLHLTAALAFLDRFELGVALPVLLSQSSQATRLVEPYLASNWSSAGIGDLRLYPKVRLATLGPVTLGLAVPVSLPTGRASSFIGQDGVSVEPRALVEVDLPWKTRLLAQAGVAFREERNLADLKVGNAFTYAVGAEQPFPLFGQRFAALGSLGGEVGLQQTGTAEVPLEGIAALRWDSAFGLNVTAGAGAGLTQGFGVPDFRLLFGIGYTSERPPAPAVVAVAPPPPPPPPPREPEPPPAPAPAPPRAVVDEPAHRIVTPQPIFFELNKARIQPRSYPVLDGVVVALRENPQIRAVLVDGHTDSSGPVAFNRTLSKRRAEAVRRYLVEHGVDAKRLKVTGHGPDHPIASNRTREGRARNRRVEFVIQLEDGPKR